MKSSRLICIAGISASALLAISAELVAQERQPGSTSESDAARHNNNTIRVPDGTVVRLLVADSISGKTATIGDPVQLRVIDEVKIGDLVVIANKAPAFATIAERRHAGRRSRPGTMSIKLDSVTLLTGQTQKLRGAAMSKGNPVDYEAPPNANDPAAVSLLVFSLPFIPFFHGEEAVLRKGTVLSAALDGEASLDRVSVVAKQPAHTPAKEGPASVTFYWPVQRAAAASRVFCGTVKLADLPQGRNFILHLPTDRYWFRMYDKKKAILLALEPGREYFVRVIPYDPGMREPSHLELVEHDVGEAEASETRPLEPGKILDVAAASTTDLRADPRRKK